MNQADMAVKQENHADKKFAMISGSD